MEHFIEELRIVNFKSIKNLELKEFSRINLFIGRPNIGKSNILEALSLFSIPYFEENSLKNLNNIIRLERPNQIFFDGVFGINNYVRLVRNNKFIDSCNFILDKLGGGLSFDLIFKNRFGDQSEILNIKFFFDEELNYTAFIKDPSRIPDLHQFPDRNPISYIKRYSFNTILSHGKIIKRPFLLPPFGSNIEYVIDLFPELKEIFEKWFNQYDLRLVLDTGSNSIRVMKDLGKYGVFSLPYSSIADTLQRIIFYKTAIVSNENSVLIFEEPEAHAFPPYIAEFTQEVINSRTNQFIMATHSPIIVNDFLENAREDLSIFMVDFNDGQTVARPLSREEIEEVYVNGVDLFFNNEAYTV